MLYDNDNIYEQRCRIISDVNCKILKQLASKKGDFDADDIALLELIRDNELHNPYSDKENNAVFKFFGNNFTRPDENASDDMVQEYADNLYNYLYTYRPEAQRLDSRIDPNEDHRGPMAQDIEKVAPDCIIDTPEGYKEVDGSRLALINAGVIGDLSRRLIALEEATYGRHGSL
jgi:hypothetical protein